LGFDDELIERVGDFRQAYLNAEEGTVMAQAVDVFIKHTIDRNPTIRDAYLALRASKGKQP
jgi:hypothetical protein